MAEYGKYKDIDEGTLSSEASELQGKLSTAQGELSSFKGELTDDIWKAGAKGTLMTAFDTLDSDVYANLNTDLGTIVSIATEIGNYKTAEKAALALKKKIDDLNSTITAKKNADPPEDYSTEQAELTQAEADLATEETNMETAVKNINALNA